MLNPHQHYNNKKKLFNIQSQILGFEHFYYWFIWVGKIYIFNFCRDFVSFIFIPTQTPTPYETIIKPKNKNPAILICIVNQLTHPSLHHCLLS